MGPWANMPSCSPSVATVSRLCFMILLGLGILQFAYGHEIKGYVWPRHRNDQLRSASRNNETENNKLTCTPSSACEPCPPEAMNQPYCRPFGNRRLVYCTNSTDDHTHRPVGLVNGPRSHSNGQPSAPPPEDDPSTHGNVIAWESCGRIVPKERADFFEFVGCNVIFALISLLVLFFRSRRMQVMQARQIAARIGIFRERGRS